MKLTDALFNWLQIRIVGDARPRDRSARDTVQFFEQILREDHQVKELRLESDDSVYRVHYLQGEEWKSRVFDRDSAEQLLGDSEPEPRSNFRVAVEGLVVFAALGPFRNPVVTFGAEEYPGAVFGGVFDLDFCRGKISIAQDATNFHRPL